MPRAEIDGMDPETGGSARTWASSRPRRQPPPAGRLPTRPVRRRGGAVLASALLLAAAPLLAQQEPTPDDPLTTPEGRAVLGRGFDPTKHYDGGDVDAVNLFNGGQIGRAHV